jgi:hypothetical protein
MPSAPCCPPPQTNVFVGDFCRCCGDRLKGEGRYRFCDRGTVPCPNCQQTTCGPHSVTGDRESAARWYCEICGEKCGSGGVCMQHGLKAAKF